jgi:hypothetical protein
MLPYKHLKCSILIELIIVSERGQEKTKQSTTKLIK